MKSTFFSKMRNQCAWNCRPMLINLQGNRKAVHEKTSLKLKTKGMVTTEITAEIINTNPIKPIPAPNENFAVAKTGAIVWARPAIAQAIPKAFP
jgi:hypothetical protein